jgi:hypothetical protein
MICTMLFRMCIAFQMKTPNTGIDEARKQLLEWCNGQGCKMSNFTEEYVVSSTTKPVLHLSPTREHPFFFHCRLHPSPCWLVGSPKHHGMGFKKPTKLQKTSFLLNLGFETNRLFLVLRMVKLLFISLINGLDLKSSHKKKMGVC